MLVQALLDDAFFLGSELLVWLFERDIVLDEILLIPIELCSRRGVTRLCEGFIEVRAV